MLNSQVSHTLRPITPHLSSRPITLFSKTVKVGRPLDMGLKEFVGHGCTVEVRVSGITCYPQRLSDTHVHSIIHVHPLSSVATTQSSLRSRFPTRPAVHACAQILQQIRQDTRGSRLSTRKQKYNGSGAWQEGGAESKST